MINGQWPTYFANTFLVRDAKARGTQIPIKNYCSELRLPLAERKTKWKFLLHLSRAMDLKCTMGVRKFKRRYIVRLISSLQYWWQIQTRKFLSVYYTMSAKIKQEFWSQKFLIKKTANLCTHGVTFFSGRMHSRVRGAYFDERIQMKLLFAVFDWSVGMWTNTWHVANNAWHAPRDFSWKKSEICWFHTPVTLFPIKKLFWQVE